MSEEAPGRTHTGKLFRGHTRGDMERAAMPDWSNTWLLAKGNGFILV